MKALIKLFIPLLVLVSFTKAQTILPLGLGQENSLNITCSEGERMWVLSKESDQYVINKWDGNFWIRYKSIPQSLFQRLSDQAHLIRPEVITYFKGDLYATFSNISTGELLILWSDGKNWNFINTDKVRASKGLEFLSNGTDLLLCGKLTFDNVNASILRIEKTTISIAAYSPAFQATEDYYSNFEYSGNKVWAIGLFSSPLDPNKRYFTSIENGVWKIVDNPPGLFGFAGLGKFNDRLIIVAKDLSGHLSVVAQNSNQNVWDHISMGLEDWDIESVSDIRQVGKVLWLAGNLYNAKTNNRASLAFWNGNTWTVPQFDFLGTDLVLQGSLNPYISGSFTSHQGLTLNRTGKLGLGNALIAGKVIYDLNQNCSQDFGEQSLPGVVIRLTPENLFTVSDYNGHYYFPVDTGVKIHGVEIQVPKYHVSTCESFKATKHINKLTIAGVDFGVVLNGNHTDAGVTIDDYTGWRARQGFGEKYRICVTNKGTQSLETGKLILKTDERLLNWEFDRNPTIAQSNGMEWDLPTLKVAENYCIMAVATIPVDVELGEKLIFDGKVYTTDVQDEDLSDNHSTLIQTIVAAIDPNDKRTEEDFWIAPSTPKITYKIRFQNQGSDTAYNIVVSDSIDQNFYIDRDGVFNPTSHEDVRDFVVNYWITPGGKYRYTFAWRFDNILLPDSKTNEEASNGFINYTLKLTPELKPGTLIRNRAYIYFDYQEPIITNTAMNLLSVNTGVKSQKDLEVLRIHPNPSQGVLNIHNPYRSALDIELINSIGQSVFAKQVIAESELVLSTEGLAKGVYYIRAEGFAPVRVVIY